MDYHAMKDTPTTISVYKARYSMLDAVSTTCTPAVESCHLCTEINMRPESLVSFQSIEKIVQSLREEWVWSSDFKRNPGAQKKGS